MYVPIHNHSHFSALDGLSTCEEIVARAVELDCCAVGLTDHGVVSGHLEFTKATRNSGIRPIYGIEGYQLTKYTFEGRERDQAHVIIGAKTSEGLKNLWRLVDASAQDKYFRYVSRVDWELLEKYSEGLFCTSACIQGLVAKGIENDDYDDLNRYIDIFGDNFYLELHTYPMERQEAVNNALVGIAYERGLPLLVASDSHFAFPEQYELHDAYIAMQTGENVLVPPADRKMWHPKSLYIQADWEIRNNLHYLDDRIIDGAFANSIELAEACTAELPEVKRHLPVFVPSECPWLDQKDLTAQELFLDLIERGVQWRYGDADTEVWERVSEEANAFLDAGLEHYFLQSWDFLEFVRSEGITKGAARGSAGGSIISYILGITDIDPIHYGLLFERFYNPGREKGFPDIDTDISVSERERVKQYLRDRWGENRVKQIGTVTRMKPKGAVKRTHRAYGLSLTYADELSDILDAVPNINIIDHAAIGWDPEIDQDPNKVYVLDHVGDEIEQWITSKPDAEHDILHTWINHLGFYCGRVEHYGIHPSGMVVSDCDLDGELPCRLATNRTTKEKIPVTMFSMKDIDERMFVKQDILGLANLDILNDWQRLSGKKVKWSGLEMQDHPEEMWHLLDRGLTLGIFQIEDGFAKGLCKRLKPRSVEEIGVIIALNRPGPKLSGGVDSYIANKNGDNEIEYDHPILEPILKPTFGTWVYQEQIINFFKTLGLSLSDADAVRKILGKKDQLAMQNLYEGKKDWKGKGYKALCTANGLSKEIADKLWKQLEGFALYSFNQSHSIGYATLAFRNLYAKYHDPVSFILAGITVNDKKQDRVTSFIAEARRMGINIQPPNILISEASIAKIEDEIVFGFSNVKGIGLGTAKYICKLRDHHEYDIATPDLLREAVKEEQEIWDMEERRSRLSPKQQVRSNVIDAMVMAGAFDEGFERDVSPEEKRKFEKELLGAALSDNSEEIYEHYSEQIESIEFSYDDLTNMSEDDNIQLPGTVTLIKETKTRKTGLSMGIVEISYTGETAEFVVFPHQWRGYRGLWEEGNVGVFTLKLGKRGLIFEEGSKLS